MKNKILILLSGSSLLFLLGLLSCKDSCGPFPNKFKVIGLDWSLYQASYSDTPDHRLILNAMASDTVYYLDYAIVIRPREETYFAQKISQWHLNLIPTAKACSPVLPTTDERIDSLLIYSVADFDMIHPAGTELTDLFDIVILDHANGKYYEKYDLKDYIATHPQVPNELTLILKGRPETTKPFQFSVKYYQNGIDDNDYFEFTTNPIVINRDE